MTIEGSPRLASARASRGKKRGHLRAYEIATGHFVALAKTEKEKEVSLRECRHARAWCGDVAIPLEVTTVKL